MSRGEIRAWLKLVAKHAHWPVNIYSDGRKLFYRQIKNGVEHYTLALPIAATLVGAYTFPFDIDSIIEDVLHEQANHR